ncbi:family 43 glycosylhydrolase [Sphingomonas japonica]|uniref:GH43 family beta-xylosidase n=1 Tax=Sphingomonas japonica TaxID=511662 RepID=A0ABX0U1S6_9SPHN|nr:GH43 family beta-xylosidase [Sphingomonas japonica]
MNLPRRPVLAGIAASVAGAVLPRHTLASRSALSNPLILQRADPHISAHGGRYYFTASVPEYDRIVLRSAPGIAGLADAAEAVLWRRPQQGRMAGHIWAPEFHRAGDRWLIYFAAGDGDDVFRIRTYVLACDDADPVAGRWSLLGQFETPWDSFTLDATVFDHRGTRYACWAQAEPGIATNSNLYLAPLTTPTTLAAPPVRLTVPTLPWEIQGFKVAEGPALLARGGRLFLTYSASATDARYCMGMLTARDDADIMDPAAWSKSPVPVFASAPEHGVYGPGHNSFVVDDRGRDLLVYHARDYAAIKGDPLYDPNRHTRVQPIRYAADGTPVFGKPSRNGPIVGTA